MQRVLTEGNDFQPESYIGFLKRSFPLRALIVFNDGFTVRPNATPARPPSTLIIIDQFSSSGRGRINRTTVLPCYFTRLQSNPRRVAPSHSLTQSVCRREVKHLCFTMPPKDELRLRSFFFSLALSPFLPTQHTGCWGLAA